MQSAQVWRFYTTQIFPKESLIFYLNLNLLCVVHILKKANQSGIHELTLKTYTYVSKSYSLLYIC